jgi:hypothetical protein
VSPWTANAPDPPPYSWASVRTANLRSVTSTGLQPGSAASLTRTEALPAEITASDFLQGSHAVTREEKRDRMKWIGSHTYPPSSGRFSTDTRRPSPATASPSTIFPAAETAAAVIGEPQDPYGARSPSRWPPRRGKASPPLGRNRRWKARSGEREIAWRSNGVEAN